MSTLDTNQTSVLDDPTRTIPLLLRSVSAPAHPGHIPIELRAALPDKVIDAYFDYLLTDWLVYGTYDATVIRRFAGFTRLRLVQLDETKPLASEIEQLLEATTPRGLRPATHIELLWLSYHCLTQHLPQISYPATLIAPGSTGCVYELDPLTRPLIRQRRLPARYAMMQALTDATPFTIVYAHERLGELLRGTHHYALLVG